MNVARASILSREESSPAIKAKKIMDYVKEYGKITDEEIQVLLDMKKTRVFNLAKQMREMELIEA